MKKTLIILLIFTIAMSMTACEKVSYLLGFDEPPPPAWAGGMDDPGPIMDPSPIAPSNEDDGMNTDEGDNAIVESNNDQQNMNLWELVSTEEIIPQTYTTGDSNDSRLYTFEYSGNAIDCHYERTVYDGIKKQYLSELIDTSGSWTLSNEDGAFLPEENVTVILGTQISNFERISTNYTGVSSWAYIDEATAAFGNASGTILKSKDGISMSKSEIIDGVITIPSNSLEVTAQMGTGTLGQQKALFVVISNQGKIGGIKYIYEWQ
ncbi:MAG: hypothetical protein JW702_08570 [Clostridiales bacterium]|nr:hypothetical protein [Clostridiales bacterium]